MNTLHSESWRHIVWRTKHLKKTLQYSIIGLYGFLSVQTAFPQGIPGGSLANAGNPGPAAVTLNLVYGLMDSTLIRIKDYVAHNQHCPPANHFKRQAGNLYLANGPVCDVIVSFGSNNPGQLQKKTIRLVIKNGNGSPEAMDFSLRQAITNIDFGANGVAPSFLLHPQKAYAYSYTMMGSLFGNTPSANISNVLNDSYEQIVNATASANSTAGDSTTGSSNMANIRQV